MRTKPPSSKPRIAIVDYVINEQSPSGSCHLRLLEGLCEEFAFTVFATTFDNPRPEVIRWVRVPAIGRPLVARYLSFYLTSSSILRLRHFFAQPFDVVQAVEGYTRSIDISYVHYCHKAYLQTRTGGTEPRGLRGLARYLDHRLRAADESRALRSALLLVVPSPGLADELGREHGVGRAVMRVIPNPVELRRFDPPEEFDRDAVRRDLGTAPSDVIVVFVALGHFERKGLPQLLEALGDSDPAVRLVVVGGDADLVRVYERRATRLGVAGRTRFVGMQGDVRPYLWAADAFASPSSYEVFSLAPLQAAAAGLPLLVTAVPGVAPFFHDGVHGFLVTRDAKDIAATLTRMARLGGEERRAMGQAARDAAAPFDASHFVSRWRTIYLELLSRPIAPAAETGKRVRVGWGPRAS